MKYIKSDKHRFINPYNFVSVNLEETKHFNVEEMKQEELQQEVPKLRTGYLVCRIKCRTPLAIPDTANKKQTDCEGHYKYPFMGMTKQIVQGTGSKQETKTELTGNPEIPGSSIRGVIRNSYETITDSCFGTMKENTRITARSNNAFKPGLLILENGNWKLYAATRHKIVADSEFYENHGMREKGIPEFDLEQWRDKSGTKVWFKTITYETKIDKKNEKEIKKKCVQSFATEKNESLKTEGYLCLGEEISGRHFHGIFQQGDFVRNVTEKDIERLEYTLEIYRNEKINKKYKEEHRGYPEYERMKAGNVIPVYYQIPGEEKKLKKGNENDNKILYLSCAALGRKAYEITLNEKVGQKSHQICNERNNLCAACSLFGTIEGKGIGSKIRFTDAKCQNFDKRRFKENVIFEELSSPRISYVPFYLFSKKWDTNYSNGYDSDELQIRGRKFYWHHEPDLNLQDKIEKTERNGTFDVLLPETEFKFRIYFDQITDSQLETLATAIHLNENNIEGKRCHKIGHGKPLGYGSVKMTVDKCKIRKYDVKNGWSEECDDELFHTISFSEMFHSSWEDVEVNFAEKDQVYRCDQGTWEDLIKISNFHEIEEAGEAKVEYPGIVFEGDINQIDEENDLAGYQWFTRNYNVGAKRPEQPLPKIGAERLLVKYELVEDKQVKDKPKQQEEEETKETTDEGRIYKARIMSYEKPANNPNYLIYEIEILEDDYYTKKKCKLSAYKGIKLKENQVVNAVLYKGNSFNWKKDGE